MKRILIFTAPVILLIMYAMGCSKNHDAPTFSKYEGLDAPSSTVAAYNSETEMIDVSWAMSDVDGVMDYYIGISDSSVFNDGNIVEFFANIPSNEIQNTSHNKSFEAIKCMPNATDAEADSIVLYFKVSAVYNNDQFKNFIGPRSDSDSVLIRQD